MSTWLGNSSSDACRYGLRLRTPRCKLVNGLKCVGVCADSHCLWAPFVIPHTCIIGSIIAFFVVYIQDPTR